MVIDQDPHSAATAALMDRFNEVFLRHDPASLPGMIAENCVIEKISPASNGDRCVGRDACVDVAHRGKSGVKIVTAKKPDGK